MINVTVAYATPTKQIEIPLQVEENCTVQLAIQRSGVLTLFPEIQLQTAAVGIFGLHVKLDSSIKAGDRIEIYRPLVMDPKELRRRKVGH